MGNDDLHEQVIDYLKNDHNNNSFCYGKFSKEKYLKYEDSANHYFSFVSIGRVKNIKVYAFIMVFFLACILLSIIGFMYDAIYSKLGHLFLPFAFLFSFVFSNLLNGIKSNLRLYDEFIIVESYENIPEWINKVFKPLVSIFYFLVFLAVILIDFNFSIIIVVVSLSSVILPAMLKKPREYVYIPYSSIICCEHMPSSDYFRLAFKSVSCSCVHDTVLICDDFDILNINIDDKVLSIIKSSYEVNTCKKMEPIINNDWKNEIDLYAQSEFLNEDFAVLSFDTKTEKVVARSTNNQPYRYYGYL